VIDSCGTSIFVAATIVTWPFENVKRASSKSIRSQLAVFLHDKHARTLDPLGTPREIREPDSLGG
jgi:hypothetical protein